MTENVLGKPFDEQLRRRAEEEKIRLCLTQAPQKGGREVQVNAEDRLHIVAERDGEWVLARFHVPLPRKEPAL